MANTAIGLMVLSSGVEGLTHSEKINFSLVGLIDNYTLESGQEISEEKKGQILKKLRFWFDNTIGDSPNTVYDDEVIVRLTNDEMRQRLNLIGREVKDVEEVEQISRDLGFGWDGSKALWIRGSREENTLETGRSF